MKLCNFTRDMFFCWKQLEKQRRTDQELKKRVLKLEFCLQESRSQIRKLQRVCTYTCVSFPFNKWKRKHDFDFACSASIIVHIHLWPSWPSWIEYMPPYPWASTQDLWQLKLTNQIINAILPCEWSISATAVGHNHVWKMCTTKSNRSLIHAFWKTILFSISGLIFSGTS